MYLLKTGIDEDAVFRSPASLTAHVIAEGDQRMGHLYIKRAEEHPPSWVRLFARRATPELGAVRNKSSSAVWVLPIRDRLFACAFGYGRGLLNPGVFEEDFGLKVTLNCVDPGKVHSIDRTTLDTISRHSQIQASRLAPIGEFGLDVEQDILQAVTGEPAEPFAGRKLSGKDSLHVSSNTEFRDIPNLLERYLGLYQSDRYREFFAFVDHIRLVKDPFKQETLNARLIERIRIQNPERLWLSIPEAIEWRSVSHFQYKPSARRPRQTYDDLHFGQLLNEVRDIAAVDVERLRYIRVEAVSVEGDVVRYDWPLYKCLNFEVDEGNRKFVLNNGKWYEVASDFANAVDETCRNVRPSGTALPEYDDRSEADYNLRVAGSDSDRFVCCDKSLVVFPSGPSRIEFCDLYTADREMIFVKKYGDSSILSHLFAQGVVSAETFRRERKFRELVNGHLPPSHELGDRLDEMHPRDFTVTFAVISESARPLDESLPFFSKVNLKNATKLLQSNGYNVRLAKVVKQRR